MEFSQFTENIEILREVAENVCKNLQRVLDKQSDRTKSFQWDELTETLLIDYSTFIKMKWLRNVHDENDEWSFYNTLKRWENENKEEQKEPVEEEEEEDEEETVFPPHHSICYKIT
jgi:hypothetical protein